VTPATTVHARALGKTPSKGWGKRGEREEGRFLALSSFPLSLLLSPSLTLSHSLSLTLFLAVQSRVWNISRGKMGSRFRSSLPRPVSLLSSNGSSPLLFTRLSLCGKNCGKHVGRARGNAVWKKREVFPSSKVIRIQSLKLDSPKSLQLENPSVADGGDEIAPSEPFHL